MENNPSRTVTDTEWTEGITNWWTDCKLPQYQVHRGCYNNTIIPNSVITNELVIWLRNCELDNISWIFLPSFQTAPGGNPPSWWHWLMRLEGVPVEVLLQPSDAENIITLGYPYWQNSITHQKNQGRLYNWCTLSSLIRNQSPRLQRASWPNEDNCQRTHAHNGFCSFYLIDHTLSLEY